MPTTSPHGLRYPALGDAPNATTAFSNALDDVAKTLPVHCTSNTRPNPVVVGRWFYETDTKTYGMWDGTRYRFWDTVGVPYVPTWRSSGTQPTLGTSTLLGRYVRHGPLCTIWGALTLANGANGGTGTWTWDLPFPALGGPLNVAGTVWSLRTNTSGYQIGNVHLGANAGTTTFSIIFSGQTTVIGATAPNAWAVGDNVRWHTTYELA